MGRGERREPDAERVGEDLVAEAHGQERLTRGEPPRDDLPHARDPGARVVARIARPGPGDHDVGLGDGGIGHRGPRGDLDREAEVAQLVREHRGEAVFGIHDERGAAGERPLALPALRVEPERREPVVAGGEERRDVGIIGQHAGRRGGGVFVERRTLGHLVPGDRADRAEHPGGLAVGLAHLAVGVGVAHQGRTDGHPQAPVHEVRGADEDRRVEIVRAPRGRCEQGCDARIVAARRFLVPCDDRARVLHRRPRDRRGEHRLAQDVARVHRALTAQHVLGVREARHLLQVRPGDAATVAADRRHHLELFVDDHEELFGLFGRREELGEGFGGRPARRVAEGARDRVHRDDAVVRADVRFGTRSHGEVAGGRDEERPVGAALVLEQGAEPREPRRQRIDVDGCLEVAPDHEVRALAAADLVGDHRAHDVGVFLVGNVEAGALERHAGGGERGDHLVARQHVVRAHDEAPERRLVVVAVEPALDDLAERHQREHLARGARGIRERDVGEQLDVDDVAAEQFNGVDVARDQGERAAGAHRGLQQGGARGHRRAFLQVGRAAFVRERKDRLEGGLCHRLRAHRRQRVGHQEALVNMRSP